MTDFEDFEQQIIELIDEDGEPIQFELIDIVEFEGKEYGLLLPVDDEDETAKAINLKDKTQENYTGLIRGYVLESPTYFLPQKLSEGISDFLNEFFGERILYARSSETAGKKLEEINQIFAAINAAPDCIEKLNNFATEQIAKKSKKIK